MFKNIVAFKADAPTITMLQSVHAAHRVSEHQLVPPVGAAWRSFGFTKPEQFGNAEFYSDERGLTVFSIGIADRALPGRCIRDEVTKRRLEMEKLENRRLGRKEIAQMKDQVISELLPHAPIKNTNTLVIVKDEWLLIETGSHNRAEEIISWLRYAMVSREDGDTSVPDIPFSTRCLTGWETHKWLHRIAIGESEDSVFDRLDSVALKGGDGSTVRMKAVDLGTAESMQTLTSGRKVTELAVSYTMLPDCEVALHCSITDSLAIKRIKFSDILLKEINEDAGETDGDIVTYFSASITIAASILCDLVNHIAVETAKPEEDDDEL